MLSIMQGDCNSIEILERTAVKKEVYSYFAIDRIVREKKFAKTTVPIEVHPDYV